jgi:hypothetical protein
MAINAKNTGSARELVPAGNYIARCYQMIEIGTVTESIKGDVKTLTKVRIGWELPDETKVFDQKKGPQPLVIDQEYTLSMNEKANLRKMLESWRGKGFTEEEAKCFDITKLIGVACMVNIIHRQSQAGNMYEVISSVTAVPKGIHVPKQITPSFILSYDSFDENLFNSLPDFIKTKMQSSAEYAAMKNPHSRTMPEASDITEPIDDLPF